MSLYPELSAHTVIPVDGCQRFCERMYPKLRWKKEKHLEETTLTGNDFHIPPKKMETCKIIDLKGAQNGKESKQSTIDFHEAKCVPFNDLLVKPNEGIWTQWRYINPSLTSNVNIYIYNICIYIWIKGQMVTISLGWCHLWFFPCPFKIQLWRHSKAFPACDATTAASGGRWNHKFGCLCGRGRL